MSHVRTIIKLELSDDNIFHVYPLGGKQHGKHKSEPSQPVRRNVNSSLRIIKVDDIAGWGRYKDQNPVNDRHGNDLEVFGVRMAVGEAGLSNFDG